MQTNTVGTFNVIRLAAERMSKLKPIDKDGQRGVIVNTTSIAGFDGVAGAAPYCATKGAIIAMTLPIAKDLGPLGIRVHSIAPGNALSLA
jgi:3-hydroxyacyl-CoA dehydrogenase / 3-hydroxy-2-methylbutyryl-CoA dehydrogenase